MLRPLIALQQMQGRLFPWVAMFLGAGIGLWFALPSDPAGWHYGLAAGILLAALLLRLRGPELLHPLAVAVACLVAGGLAAGVRAHLVAAPMLEFRYYGPVQGRIVEIDRSQSDALRLTLDRVVLDRVAPDRTPVRVRISLHGDQRYLVPEPGQVVMLTGHLTAPEGPVEPGSFDFRRKAFFDQLGAVGYTRSPVLLLAPPEAGAQAISRLRAWLAQSMRAAMPGQAGAFAAGAMTGDRSGIDQDTVAALRDSSLAHLLAISGMNLAFLIGFVFALIRYGIALIPLLALRVNAKKVAAVVALGIAFFYLLLSGANVATTRAFIMVTVMLGAVLLDRRALTLRSVAIAAILILLTTPEALLDPGFQMSFAATVALIWAFGAVDAGVMRERLPRWMLPVFTLVLSSVVAGFATAPYAAAHFNRYSDYGLLANLLTVPVMGAVVMPAGAVASLLAPFGLAAPALWAMQAGSAWILAVAHWISGLNGAVSAIPAPPLWVLPLITLAGAWLILWRGPARWAASGPALLALWLWASAERPLILIAGDAALVGLMGAEGRALSTGTGGGFAAKSWLENDGDLAAQDQAAARPGFSGPKGARVFVVAGLRGVALKGKGADVAAACATGAVVIVAAVVEAAPKGCVLIDQGLLRRSGPLAVNRDLTVTATRQVARLWSGGKGGFPALPDLTPKPLGIAENQ
ncbi:MAG: ComEC/Rec2 family competence protein [Pseudomonadota bacterium]